MPYTYEYPKADFTVDAIVFGVGEGGLEILLIKRGDNPFKGHWALPGGFVNMDETIEAAVQRELQEETGAKIDFLEQLYTFGDPGRDPRGRVVSVAYYGLVSSKEHHVVGDDDAEEARWFPLSDVTGKLPLAFDHAKILKMGVERLRGKIRYAPIGFNLLPKSFTLGQLQKIYETILGRELDKRNFRKRILAMEILKETGGIYRAAHRPAKLYRFDKRAYIAAVKDGFNFEI